MKTEQDTTANADAAVDAWTGGAASEASVEAAESRRCILSHPPNGEETA